MPWFDKLTTRVEKDGRDTSHEGRPMRSKFARFQTRELLLVVLPVLAVVLGAVWIALRLVDPPPPRTFVVSAATAGSPYYRYAERYKAGDLSLAPEKPARAFSLVPHVARDGGTLGFAIAF